MAILLDGDAVVNSTNSSRRWFGPSLLALSARAAAAMAAEPDKTAIGCPVGCCTLDLVNEEADLLAAVDAACAVTARGLAVWPDPRQDREPLDAEYSRVTNPARYRIIGARADAWVTALVQRRLATTSDRVEWVAPPSTLMSRAVLVQPTAAGALAVVIARHQLGDCDDAGITLGVGHPATCVAFFPDCGCDACDSGSQNELDVIDRHLSAVVTGRYRRLSRGDRQITIMDDSMSASNIGRRDINAVLEDHTGWVEISGASWTGPLTRHR